MIKKLGDGNFTEVYQVQFKEYEKIYFSLKICSMQKVRSKRKETDILMEKHALNKLKEKYSSRGYLPCVKILNTFKDDSNLYFITELLSHKNELWERCHSFGMISPVLTKQVFHKSCLAVKDLHSIGIIHRDIKPENMFLTED